MHNLSPPTHLHSLRAPTRLSIPSSTHYLTYLPTSTPCLHPLPTLTCLHQSHPPPTTHPFHLISPKQLDAFCWRFVSFHQYLDLPKDILLPRALNRRVNRVARIKTADSSFFQTRFRGRCYSSKRAIKNKRSGSETAMKDDREAFFVVRKGDIIGIYKSLNDCQAQVGSSIMDPPVSVYKGNGMRKDAEKYLISYGLRNALYTVRADDLTEGLFGTLVPCPYQIPSSSRGETSNEIILKKRSHEEAMYTAADAGSCTLEFDGASKGNPGQAGAGVVIRADDGSLIWKVREGLGIATCNAAEYRAIILGLQHALQKGFTSIRVRGDSKLVCMQIQGLWKVKNQNIAILYQEAKKLKEKFLSFQIMHILRDLNTEADEQANLATKLADGQIQEEVDE